MHCARPCGLRRALTAALTRRQSCGVAPAVASSKVLRHIHFRHVRPYDYGLQVQEQFVRANLDFKAMVSKLEQREKAVQQEGYALNDYESLIIAQIRAAKPPPVVLTFEFEPTYTGGKREKKASHEEYTRTGAKYVQLERGGEVTFHGPGQMVAYPIVDLRLFTNLPIRCFVDKLEKAVVAMLRRGVNVSAGETAPFNIDATTGADRGVWVDGDKIASVGVNVRRSVTSFGTAVNVSTDLSYMNSVTMCGLPDKQATSMQQLGVASLVRDVGMVFAEELARQLGIPRVEHVEVEGDLETAGALE